MIMSDPAFEPYACSLGAVVAHEGLVYVIATADGRTIGILANDQPGPAAVEFDIANPPAIAADPALAWNAFLAGAITDPVSGLSLKASIAACNRFTAMEALLKSAIEHGVLNDNSPVPIWDASNTEHVLSVHECRALLLRYGLAWQTSFNALAP